MRTLRWAATLIVVLTVMVVARAGFGATTYEVGTSSRVFKPAHARNWRGAKTEALITTIWYPVSADAPGVVEQPQVIGPPGSPLLLAGKAAVDAPLAAIPPRS